MTRPSDSGASRCGQRSASATASPELVRNSTISSPHTVRASGVPPISRPKAITCQQLRSHMSGPPGRTVTQRAALCAPAQGAARRGGALTRGICRSGAGPQMLDEAEKAKIDMTDLPPARLEELVASLYRTPPDMIETVKKVVPNRSEEHTSDQ